MQSTYEALATKTVDADKARHLVIKEATHFHPTCGQLTALGFQAVAA